MVHQRNRWILSPLMSLSLAISQLYIFWNSFNRLFVPAMLILEFRKLKLESSFCCYLCHCLCLTRSFSKLNWQTSNFFLHYYSCTKQRTSENIRITNYIAHCLGVPLILRSNFNSLCETTKKRRDVLISILFTSRLGRKRGSYDVLIFKPDVFPSCLAAREAHMMFWYSYCIV